MKHRKIKIPWFFGYGGITIYPFSFIVREYWDDNKLQKHEQVHYEQQQKWYDKAWFFGILAHRLLYYLFLPIGWNPIRWAHEVEAFIKGNGMSLTSAKERVKREYFLWWHK